MVELAALGSVKNLYIDFLNFLRMRRALT